MSEGRRVIDLEALGFGGPGPALASDLHGPDRGMQNPDPARYSAGVRLPRAMCGRLSL